MDRLSEIKQILEEEYGISTVKELNAAISKLGNIDISIFCEVVHETDRRLNHDTSKTQAEKRTFEKGKNQESQAEAS